MNKMQDPGKPRNLGFTGASLLGEAVPSPGWEAGRLSGEERVPGRPRRLYPQACPFAVSCATPGE